MKHHSGVMKNQVGKTIMCILLYLVIAPRYFLERLFKQKIKDLKLDCLFYE